MQCALHWLELSKRFLLLILLGNLQTFFLLCSFCWKLAVATTALNFEHVISLLVFCPLFVQILTLGWHPTQLTFLYQVVLTLLVSFIFCVSHSDLHSNLLFQSCHTFVSSFIVLPYSGYQLLFFLGRVPINLWTLPAFSELSNMSPNDLTNPVAAVATAQVKLCPYDEEEPHIWFCLIEAQFAAAGIRSQKLKYDNALASLPKQVLWDILDTLDVCTDSGRSFRLFKKYFAWPVWEEQVVVLFLTTLSPHGKGIDVY
jgi:hypothetical protein